MVPTVAMTSAGGGPAVIATCVAVLSIAVSWLATRVVRSHVIRHAMFDVPNQRSSHTVPTPRGGGAAIVLVVLSAIVLIVPFGWLSYRAALGLGVGGALVSLVGWLDDRHNVSAAWRAFAHVSAAVWAVYWVGGFGVIRIGSLGTIPSLIGDSLAVLCIAWMTNLYNFMDGIDGIASAEAIISATVGAALLIASDAAGLALVCAALAGACAGFLIWNRMPARIFMGDVGSGFIGFVLATIALTAQTAAGLPILLWLLLLLVFVADATITLFRRFLHGDPWHLAHRLHAYQRLAQSGLSHSQVVAWVSVLNVCLAALAWTAFLQPHLIWLMLLVGLVLVGLAYTVAENRRPMWTTTDPNTS